MEELLYSAGDRVLVAQRGCGLSHWRYSGTVWMKSCFMCSRVTLLT